MTKWEHYEIKKKDKYKKSISILKVELKNETANGTKPVLGVVYCVFDDGNYDSVPQIIRMFNTKEKAIEFCKSRPFERYWWDEMEVE